MLVRPATTVDPRSATAHDLDALFREAAARDHIVVADGGLPLGLVTRVAFSQQTAGPFGWSLQQRKPALALAKRSPLIVRAHVAITWLGKRAMRRPMEDVYDPVVVIDEHGLLAGTVSMKDLLERSIELQVAAAQGASPLTGLPGNQEIERWLASHFDAPGACVVYADLDRFKEFNDRYGFLVGDEMLRLTADTLVETFRRLRPAGRVGHVGGDDFVAMFPDGVPAETLDAACEAFDEARLRLFSDDDVARGWFEAHDRKGQSVEVPLVTLSLAAIQRSSLSDEVHPALLSQVAASLKAKVKESTARSGRSGWMRERRRYGRE